MALTEYDDFGVQNGHAIIGDWVAFAVNDVLCKGQITGMERTGVTREDIIPYNQDYMVINNGQYKLVPHDDDWNLYDAVKITEPCMCGYPCA
jgi:hypothetical protein